MGFLKWLWRDLVKTLKDERGIWPLVIGAGAGLASGLWAANQAKKAKPIEYPGQRISPTLTDFPSYAPTQRSIGALRGPAGSAELLRSLIMPAARKTGQYGLENITLPRINQEVSNAGIGRTSMAMKLRSQAAQALANDLMQTEATAGLEGAREGFTNARLQPQLYSGLLGREQAQQAGAVGQDMNLYGSNVQQQQRYQDLKRSAVPTGISIGAQTAGLLGQLGVGGSSSPAIPGFGGYGWNTPWGTQDVKSNLGNYATINPGKSKWNWFTGTRE